MSLSPDFFPRIDYANHPAFSSLGVADRNDNAQVEEAVGRIDAALTALSTKHFEDDAGLTSAFDAGPGTEITKLRGHLLRTTSNARVAEWLDRTMVDTQSKLLIAAQVLNLRSRSEAKRSSDAGQKVAADLFKDGMFACHLDSATLQELRSINAPYMALLRERAKSQKQGRLVQDYWQHSKTSILLERFFKRHGIIEGLCLYYGTNVNFEGFALEYSFAKQSWWRGVYNDVGLPVSRTNYMHYDQSCKNPKSIVALSDISPENGPTGYIRGSHSIERSRFLHFFMKSLDGNFSPDPEAPREPTYFRPHFSDPYYRREFLMLPRVLQGTSHFGEDIEDGTPIAEELLKNEIKLTRDVGNCIVFDGDYGIHRGGIVTSGERFVFQIIFGVAPRLPLNTEISNRLRGFVRRHRRGEGPIVK